MIKKFGTSLLGRFFLILVLIAMELGVMPVQQVSAAAYTVTNTNDSGPGSLRQAIADAGAWDVITFHPSLAGAVITLASDLEISYRLTIDGSGLTPQLTISGGDVAHLVISSSAIVTISSLTITHGEEGGIVSSGDLTVLNSTLKDNDSTSNGGGIYSSGTLTLRNSTITNNQASLGGGIAITANTTNNSILNSTIVQNTASTGGGISVHGNAVVEVNNSTFAGNSAPEGAEIEMVGAATQLLATNTIFVCTPENSNCYTYSVPSNISQTNSILGVGTLSDYGIAALADNGGPTRTMALLPGSQLLDAGNDVNCPTTDQRGIARPKGSHCDIGAYEAYQSQTLVRYVKQDANGLQDGSSWANAYTDLQSALTGAFPEEEIWVAAGTYKPTTGGDRSLSFNLHNGLALYGGFVGGETSLAQRDPVAYPTILSGDIGNDGDSSDNSYHVVVGSGTNNSAILDGFVVSGGNANLSPNDRGGGLYVYQGEPLITNTTFKENAAYFFGGGLYIGGDYFSPEIISHPVLTNLIIKNNTAAEGAGLFTENYIHAVMTDIVFDGNTATRSGGGMEDRQGTLVLTNVVFKNNTAPASGGMQNFSQDTTFANVTFSGNSATYGGGLVNANVNPVLTNVTFYANTAEQGGGMWNSTSRPVLTNVTFYKNSASTFGGAIYSDAAYSQIGSQTTLRNAILWGNTAPTGAQIYNDGISTVTGSDSVIEGGLPGGTNIITTDPKLGTLGNYGGFTDAIPLQAGSSAIDTGNDANCPAIDQRGVTRPKGSHCDIGAYEYEDLTPPTVLSIVRAGPNPTSAGTVSFTVSFSENVSNVGMGDFSLTTTGLTGAAITNVTGSGASYTVIAATGSGSGTIRLNLVDDDSIVDLANLPLGGAGGGNGNFQGETYDIIHINISGNAGVAGATLSYTDGSPKTVPTDGSGNYSFTVPYDWSGSVTPSKTGYAFAPGGKTYSNLTSNQVSQNYAATAITYTISGNTGVAGATLSYTDGSPKTATTDGSGSYSFTVSYNWSGTVIPSKAAYTFSPSSRTYASVTSNKTAQNYTAALIPPPSAVFDAWPLNINVQSSVEFHIVNTSNLSTCTWDYGDGSSPGTSCSPYNTHTYTTPGFYTVSLSVTGPGGSNSLTLSKYITVYPTLVVNKTGNGTGIVTSNPAGINCGLNCSGNFNDQTLVALTAVPLPGSIFIGWSGGGCSGTDPCTLTVQTAVTVTAHFEKIVASCPSITGWKGEYWVNNSLAGLPVLCRNDASLDFNWGSGSPDSSIPVDNFSAQWTRTINLSGGAYRFHVDHDDGARLYIDDMLHPVLNAWDICCVVDSSDPITLSDGDHVIRMEYYEGAGAANAHLWWEKLSPDVLSITRADPDPTSASSVHFNITFSENVTNVDVQDFYLTATGISGSSITGVVGSGAARTVTVNTGVGNGTIRLDVVDNDSILNGSGVPLGGIGAGNGNYNTGEVFTVRKNPTFADVPTSHLYYKDIEILYANGLTGGCNTSPLKFCPDKTMNRGEAAVFILRGNFGPGFVPGSVTHVFKDDWTKGTWAEPWAEAMLTKGLSAGCQTFPLKYCPWDQIPREQAVIFALRLKYGSSYAPPPATGTLFADLTDTSYYATPWVEQAYKDGLLPPCGTSGGKPKICPAALASRGLGAYMIVRAKGLSMP